MKCNQCVGLMVVDSFIGLEDQEGHLWLRACRCVNCVQVVEPVITQSQ